MAEETLYESERTLRRDDISSYLCGLADAVESNGRVPVDDDGTVTVDPPSEAAFQIELEREDGTLVLELEMAWPEREGDGDAPAAAGGTGDPSTDETDESDGDGYGGSGATFQLFEDSAGEWRWRLVHANGNIIADSGEGSASKQKAKQGLDGVRQNAPEARTETAD